MSVLPFAQLFLALLTASALYGQSNSTGHPYQIKLSPLRAADPVNAGVEISLERKLGNRYSVQTAYAYMTDALVGYQDYSDYGGNRFAAELKRFFRRKNSGLRYGSVELVSSAVRYSAVRYFEPKRSPADTGTTFRGYADSIRLSRKTLSLNLRVGRQFFFGKRFVCDIGFGLGVKYRNVTHAGRLVPADLLTQPRHPNAVHEAEKERRDVTANLPFTFKIGYCF